MNTSIVTTRGLLLARVEDAEASASPVMSEEEFRAFYDRTSRPVWLYLARITGDRSLADDFLQEAFYRFYRAGRSYESEQHRRNSLFTIATNLARDAHRRVAGFELQSLEDASEVVNDSRAGSADSLHARTDLHRAMARLRPEQRQMLWLAYANGSSHEEIAEVVGLTPASVKSLLLRARRKLAGFLSGRRGEGGPS